ncbi:MAG: helix-turn-helix domain-containing protein [Anaerolineae bacterium]
MVGERIRQRRKELGYSLRELGARTDLTASFLSQVENGQCSPSLSSLQRIAIALEVPMFAFLETTPSPHPVVRQGERPRLHTSDAEIAYELLSRDLSGQLMAVLIRIQPGGHRIAERLSKPTDEMMYVLSGQLSITLEDQTYVLNPGDSISYRGQSLREFGAAGHEETSVICCITPPVL